ARPTDCCASDPAPACIDQVTIIRATPREKVRLPSLPAALGAEATSTDPIAIRNPFGDRCRACNQLLERQLRLTEAQLVERARNGAHLGRVLFAAALAQQGVREFFAQDAARLQTCRGLDVEHQRLLDGAARSLVVTCGSEPPCFGKC